MGHCADWNRKNYKKVMKLADGSADLPDTGYNPEVEDYQSPVEVSYSASGQGMGDYGGGGRIGFTKQLDEGRSLNMGVSGSHWKGGGESGQSLDALDATLATKAGNFGVRFEPKRKAATFTFYKEF